MGHRACEGGWGELADSDDELNEVIDAPELCDRVLIHGVVSGERPES